MDLVAMKEKRAALVKEARALLDKAEAEGRNLTGEERQQWEKMMADVDAIAKDIEVLERQLNMESQLASAVTPVVGGKEQPIQVEKKSNPLEAAEYRKAYWEQFRHGKQALSPDEYRQLVVGTDAKGGYLVPVEFERQLIDALQEENVIRPLVTKITTSGDHLIPVVASHGQAYWTGEGAAYTESDEGFAQKSLGAHKLTALIKVSEELLQDSAFDLQGYISREFARRIGVAEEDAMVNGLATATDRPKGILAQAQVGKETAAATAIAADEIIELYHSLKPPYRSRAVWVMNDNVVKAIRMLKVAADANYLWQPGLQAGQPDMILGRPVVVCSAMPATMAAGAKTIAFGDLSYYWLATRSGIVFQRLDELYAANGFVGFRAYERIDGDLILPEAVKVLLQNDGV